MDKITERQTYVLVGQFMKEWAIVEIVIDRLVAGALGLDSTQALVVSKVLQLKAKVSLIMNMIKLLPKHNDDNEIFKKIHRELEKLTKDRNMVVHSTFFVSKNGQQVDFCGANIVDEKPDLLFASWTDQDFFDRFERMHNLLGELEELRKILKFSPNILGLVRVLFGAQPNIYTMEFGTGADNSP